MSRKTVSVRTVKTSRQGIVFKWRDPNTGKTCQRAYKGKNTRNAIETARQQIDDEVNRAGSSLAWGGFIDRVENTFYAGMAKRSCEKPRRMLRLVEAEFHRRGNKNPLASDLTTEIVLAVEEQLAASGVSAASVHSNMASLWAVINWGADVDISPRLHKPRRRTRKSERKQQTRAAKGRALTLEEVERMETAIIKNPVLDPDQPPARQRVRKSHEPADVVINAMHVMRLLGLRLADTLLLRWEPAPGCHWIDLESRTPAMHLCDEQKSGKPETVPLTPPAVKWLRSIEQPTGYVCRLPAQAGGYQQTTSRLGRIIERAGRSAGIIVKPDGGKMGAPKYASAHDLRRTFVTFWLSRLNIAEVRTLSRHASVETLLRYYTDSSDAALAYKLRSVWNKEAKPEPAELPT